MEASANEFTTASDCNRSEVLQVIAELCSGPHWSADLSIARIEGERIMVVIDNTQESYNNSGAGRGPSRTTWPPAWLLELGSTGKAAAPPLPEVEPVAVAELAVVEVAASDANPEAREPEPAHDDDDVIEIDWNEIDPCPTCGSLEKWWSMTGQERCQNCDYPSRAMFFLQQAAYLRQLANAKA